MLRSSDILATLDDSRRKSAVGLSEKYQSEKHVPRKRSSNSVGCEERENARGKSPERFGILLGRDTSRKKSVDGLETLDEKETSKKKSSDGLETLNEKEHSRKKSADSNGEEKESHKRDWKSLPVPITFPRRLSLPVFKSRSSKNSTVIAPSNLHAVDESDEAPPTPRSTRRPVLPPPAPPQHLSDKTPSCSTPPIIIVNEDEEVEGTDSSPPSTPSSARSVFYLQSSGSLLAKSAPSTPQGERLLQPTPRVPPVQRSPSHVFNRQDRQALKQLSASAPVMTQAQAAARPQPASEPVLTTAPAQESGSSKSRQKKFHRHFKTVSPEERVLNYYSCALVGDILLQGHLYITKNYFAFYSNVFGYVTKLLIPTVSVLKVSKEKTARIIPNAIGVATGLEKHVFGSLLSRDSTYRLMMQVWKEAIAQGPKIPITITKVVKDEADSVSGDINLPEDEDSSLSGSERSCPPTPLDCPTDLSHSESCVVETPKLPIGSMVPGAKHILLLPKRSDSVSRPTVLLAISTGLLVLLFLSAAFLLYRIGRIHNQFVENPLLTSSDEIYQEILKWQTQLHSRSANEVQEFLNSNLDQLIKVRQSLEVLSQLIVMEGENVVPQQRQQKEQKQKSEDNRELPRDRHS